jgi:predicted amidohydrolase YtcJ
VTDALKILTINSAYSVHQEREKGSIEKGKDADFTIIDRDPYLFEADKGIYDTKVLTTIKAGRATYTRAKEEF